MMTTANDKPAVVMGVKRLPGADFILVVSGGFTLLFGLLELLGWLLELPLSVAFGAEIGPMPPGAAVIFLCYGLALILRVCFQAGRWVAKLFAMIVCGGLMVSILLLVLGHLDLRGAFVHCGVGAIGWTNAPVVQRIPVVDAYGLVLAGVSLLASLLRFRRKSWRVAMIMTPAMLLLGGGVVFLQAYLCGSPILYGAWIEPPELSTVLAFEVLAAGLVVLSRRHDTSLDPGTDDDPVNAFTLFWVFLLLVAGIVMTGFEYYQHERAQFREGVEKQLTAIARLKVDELVRWRGEHMLVAKIFFNNPSFNELVRRQFRDPDDAGSRKQLLDWLGKYFRASDYDQIRLLDSEGVTRLSLPDSLWPTQAETCRVAAEVLASGRITIQDFFRHEHNQRVFLAVHVPVYDELDGGRPLGVLVLRIDPAIFIYPFIQRWPTANLSAETLLVRRDGDAVQFLSGSKFRADSALKLRVPLGRTEVLAVKAALGRRGIMEGRDYCGCPSLAAVYRIPDSPWLLVSRVDMSEVFSPMAGRLWQVMLLTGSLLVCAAACVGLVWGRQQARYFKVRMQASDFLRQREIQLRAALESTADGILVVDQQGKVLQASRQFAEMWNIPADIMATSDDNRMLGFVLDQLVDPAGFLHKVEELYHSDEVSMDHLLFKNGRIFERYSQPMFEDGVRIGRVWSFRDVTERQRAEATMASSLQEKEVLLKEIHHRVKNNLQVISSLLRLQSGKLGNAEARAALLEMQNRVRSMSLIHEHLYRSSNLAAVSMDNYIKSLSLHLIRALVDKPGRVRLQLNLAAIHLGVDQAVPCGLLVNELVSNAIKHGFPADRSGEVQVEFQPSGDGNGVRLRVADDGAGLPPGFDMRHLTTLGMQLVANLTRQIGGKLTIGPEPGAEFVVEFIAG